MKILSRAIPAAAFLSVVLWAVSAHATTAPSDPCSLLTAAQVGGAFGGTYAAPTKAAAPKPFANSGPGTDCRYAGAPALWFRIYFDGSTNDATGIFAQIKPFYGVASTLSGIGDEAYIDSKGALHARKGNVRFYLDAGAGKQTQLQALAGIVAKGL